LKWVDRTSYRANDKGEPRVLELRLDGFGVINIHRSIYGNIDEWFLSCHRIGIKDLMLKSKEKECAQNEAVSQVYKKIVEWKLVLERYRKV